MQLCQLAEALTALFLAWGSLFGLAHGNAYFRRAFRLGTAGAFESPTDGGPAAADHAAGLAAACHRDLERRAQVATITGPALGGLAYALSPGVPYGIMVLFWLLGAILTGGISLTQPAAIRDSPTQRDLFAGVSFVRNNPAILGTISLDLFAVLLGGATALLPIYARDILHTGPLGLGILRAAPAVGALLMTALLARHTISRRVGMRMFQAVIVFGAATVVFALSHWMWLSVLALACIGRGRYRQCGDPVFAGAAGDAGCDARPRRRGQLSVHQRVQPARRIRKRRRPRPCSARCRRPCWAVSAPSRSRCCG